MEKSVGIAMPVGVAVVTVGVGVADVSVGIVIKGGAVVGATPFPVEKFKEQGKLTAGWAVTGIVIGVPSVLQALEYVFTTYATKSMSDCEADIAIPQLMHSTTAEATAPEQKHVLYAVMLVAIKELH